MGGLTAQPAECSSCSDGSGLWVPKTHLHPLDDVEVSIASESRSNVVNLSTPEFQPGPIRVVEFRDVGALVHLAASGGNRDPGSMRRSGRASLVAVVNPANLRNLYDRARLDRLYGPVNGTVHVQGPMNTGPVIVREVLGENSP